MKYYEISEALSGLNSKGREITIPRVRIKVQSNTFQVLDDIKKGISPKELPPLEFLSLWSFERKEYWEWMLPDLLTFSDQPILYSIAISDKLYKAMLPYISEEYVSFYKANLIYHNQIIPYYLVVFRISFVDFVIDFKSTKFCIFDTDEEKLISIYSEPIDCLDDFISHSEKVFRANSSYRLNIEMAKIKDNMHFLEFFRFSTWLISEPLYLDLIKLNFEGLEFTEFHNAF